MTGVFDKGHFMGMVSYQNQVSYLLPTPDTHLDFPPRVGSDLWHKEIKAKNKADYHSQAEKTIETQISSWPSFNLFLIPHFPNTYSYIGLLWGRINMLYSLPPLCKGKHKKGFWREKW